MEIADRGKVRSGTRRRALGLGPAILAVALLPRLAAAGGDDPPERDVVTLADGKELRGRVLSRYGPGPLILLQKGEPQEIPQEDVKGVATERDRLAQFLAQRDRPMKAAEAWKLVEVARKLGLEHMAEVQAWQVLVLDPAHEGANEMLGHRAWREGYRWNLPRGSVKPKEFDERTRRWKDRFVLESEHWIVETNAGLRRAVDCAMDLERAYVEWMKDYGEALQAREFVLDTDRKMVMWILANPDEKGVGWMIPSEHEPYYSGGTGTTTKSGNPNVSITYCAGAFPKRFFDVAAQQMMYSLLVLGDVKGDLPRDEVTRHSHWVELGMGYSFGNTFGGEPGYATRRAFLPEERLVRLARKKVDSGPLTQGGKELTNLVGMETVQFYTSGDLDDVHRAKACSFFRFLETAHPAIKPRKGPPIEARDALYRYIRDVYGTPKGHSSSALDDCLGGGHRPLEKLEEPWEAWRGQ